MPIPFVRLAAMHHVTVVQGHTKLGHLLAQLISVDVYDAIVVLQRDIKHGAIKVFYVFSVVMLLCYYSNDTSRHIYGKFSAVRKYDWVSSGRQLPCTP